MTRGNSACALQTPTRPAARRRNALRLLRGAGLALLRHGSAHQLAQRGVNFAGAPGARHRREGDREQRHDLGQGAARRGRGQELDQLDQDRRPQDVDLSSNGYHPLKGDQRGRDSITVSRHWRITFGWDDTDATNVDLEDYHGR